MRESERNVGRADNNLAGARSVAEGDSQAPEKVVDDDASRASSRRDASDSRDAHQDSAVLGDEGTANTSPEHGRPERKPNT
jgi:hypothetical protein